MVKGQGAAERARKRAHNHTQRCPLRCRPLHYTHLQAQHRAAPLVHQRIAAVGVEGNAICGQGARRRQVGSRGQPWAAVRCTQLLGSRRQRSAPWSSRGEGCPTVHVDTAPGCPGVLLTVKRLQRLCQDRDVAVGGRVGQPARNERAVGCGRASFRGTHSCAAECQDDMYRSAAVPHLPLPTPAAAVFARRSLLRHSLPGSLSSKHCCCCTPLTIGGRAGPE